MIRTRWNEQIIAWRRREWVALCWAFVGYLGQRIAGDQCVKSAAMLAYVTLLAIVPLMTIGFSVFAAFPVFEGVTDRLREGLVEHLVPAAGEVVEEYLENFVARAAELTAVGVLGLAVSALLLLNTVERVLNGIWRVARPRPTLQRFMVYWTVLTLGPLLIGASVVSTSFLASFSLGPWEAPSNLVAQVLTVAPFFVQAAVFTLIYTVVPHRRVPIVHGLVGGVVASLLFEIAKSGFSLFVSQAPTYEVVYGALAALPIFLVWLYISWWVILLGAEVTQALRGFRLRHRSALGGQRWRMRLAVHLLGHLYQAQQAGRGLSLSAFVECEPQVGESALMETLEQLRSHRVVDRSSNGQWRLVRDASTFTLADLQRAESYPLPPVDEIGEGDDLWDRRLADRLRRVEARWSTVLDVPLSEFFAPTAKALAEQAEQQRGAQQEAKT